MKKYLFILSIAFILASCHSSKKVYPSDPIYDNAGKEYVSNNDKNHNDREVSKQRKEIIKEAKKWIGTKYAYAGKTKNGTDCSGMVMTIYKNILDINLPRNSAKQAEFCTGINKRDLLPGDLVFFATGKNKNRISHVGIYIGNGDMIHASTSRGVTINNLSEQYYTKTYICSGRVIFSDTKHSKNKNQENNSENQENNRSENDFSNQFFE